MKLVALVLVVAAGAWAYYANKSAPSMDMNVRVASGSTPFPVVMGQVERGRVTGTVVYTGSVAAYNDEEIYPRVTGRIIEMPVYPGDAIRAGQVVARLDSVELSSRVREADAMLATALANRAQMEADVIAAQQGVLQMEKELAMVDAELTYARLLFARTTRLFNSGAVSRQEYESDRSLATAAEAKWAAARAKLDQAHAMESAARKKLEAAESMIAQSRAAAQTAQIVRDYVNILAPSSGYVVKRLVAPGVLVQPGMAILKTTQIDRVRLQANVGEKDLSSIRVGSPVTVTFPGAGRAPVTARVTSLFPFVDPGARTAVVEAIVDNRDRKFVTGEYVRMQFTTGDHADALSVPAGTVVRLGAKTTVWVAKDNQVEPRAVTTGLENDERVEILSGLQPGERVVVRGQEGLYAGARVADASTPAQPGGHEGHGGAEKGTSMPGMEMPVKPQPAPARPEAADPHKGMKMPGGERSSPARSSSAPAAPSQASDPHKGMDMPASPREPQTGQETSDPHKGMNMPARP